MPVYNAEKYLSKAVNSILNQTFEDFELLICDDASTDASYKICESFKDKRITLYKNEYNKGYLKTSNFLVSKTKGEYITFQDADDISHLQRIDILVKFLIENNKDFVGSNVSYIDLNDKILRNSNYPCNMDENYLIENQMPFCGSSILFRRSVLDCIGLYDTSFDRMGAEDFDWIYRVSTKFEVLNVDDILYMYRMNPQGVSKISSEKSPVNIFCENIAKKLYIQRLTDENVDSEEFVKEQVKIISHNLDINSVPIFRKKIFLMALMNQRVSLFKAPFEVKHYKGPLLGKITCLFYSYLYLCFGFNNVFYIKGLIKKTISFINIK